MVEISEGTVAARFARIHNTFPGLILNKELPAGLRLVVPECSPRSVRHTELDTPANKEDFQAIDCFAVVASVFVELTWKEQKVLRCIVTCVVLKQKGWSITNKEERVGNLCPVGGSECQHGYCSDLPPARASTEMS